MEQRLQKFARLIEIGSFTQAAKELHISQPALTLAIKKLEKELGGQLFVRGYRKLELTKIGKRAYIAAQDYRSMQQTLVSDIDKISRSRPKISIGMIDSVASALSASNNGFNILENKADLAIIVDNSRQLNQALIRKKVDIIIRAGKPDENDSIKSIKIGDEKLILVANKRYASSISSKLNGGNIMNNFLSYDEKSITNQLVTSQLAEEGIRIQTNFFSTSPDVMLHMVKNGSRFAVLPYLFVEESIKKQELVPVTKNGKNIIVRRPIWAMLQNNNELSVLLEPFITYTKGLLDSASNMKLI